MSDDLVLCFLHFDDIAKLVRLRRLSFPYDLGVGFKQTQEFVRKLRDALQYPGFGLPHHPAYLIRHGFQTFSQSLYRSSPAGRQPLDFLQHALRIVENLSRQAQQLPILPLPFPFSIHPFVAHRLRDGDHALAHTPRPISDLALQPARLTSNLFHGPRQHSRAVTQQTAVGRIVNVGFHHGGVHPHPSPLNHSPLLRYGHDAIVQFRDGLRAYHLSQSHQRLGVRNLLHPDPTEAAIHHVGSHLPLQRFITPVAHMLQNQHPQSHFRRRLLPSSHPTLLVSLALGVVDRIQQLLIL